MSQPKRRLPNANEGAPYIMLDMLMATKAPMLLTRTEQVVLNVMLAEYRLGEPYCLLNQSQIAERAQMKRQNVATAIKRLVADGWVGRVSPSCWTVNPHYGYRGSRNEWNAARRKTDPPRVHDAEGEAWLAEIASAMEFDPETGEVK